jgi:20S proteasome alpha/beta subunit
LGLESKRNRKEHGQCQDFPGETVRFELLSLSILTALTRSRLMHRYNDDISLEDAIHTALLTLKEGFEGQMTEKTIELGVITVPSEEDQKAPVGGRVKPCFRKLSEEEVKDYLSL